MSSSSSSRKSNYVLLVDNVSSMTTSRDIEKEMEYCGRVRNVVRSVKYRCALVEYERSSDCKYAWRKMDRFKMDGREWKVEYANKGDFKFFGWKWFEDTPSPSRSRSRSRGRSESRSPTPKSRSRLRSASPAPKSKAARSRSPDTPRNQDDKRSVSRSD